MKSRVNRFKYLHEEIDNSIEESTQTKELSSFANRLNKIDDQFVKMEVPMGVDKPSHARNIQTEEDSIFDTFENEYLKDFLDEVKAYNVEKGYRNVGDTQSNILKELHSDIKPKRVISKNDIELVDDLGSSAEEWHDFTRRNRFVEANEFEESRDIHQEVLALTQEIDLEEVEPLPFQSLTEIKPIPVDEIEEFEEVVEEVVEEDVKEEIVEEVEEVVEEILEDNIKSKEVVEEILEDNIKSEEVVVTPDVSIEDEMIFEGFYEDTEMYEPKNVRRSRLINISINLLLVGIVLGAALVIKTFLLK